MSIKEITKAVSDKLLLGMCVPCIYQNISKVRVATLDLDSYLLAYFKKYDFFYAHNPNKHCKSGDIVLIKKLDQKLTKLVTHELIKVVYPLGDVTDPVTNKKCVSYKTRELINKEIELYGRSEHAFDYDEAPERGWQEGKKDFTDKEVYIKYHEFEEDDENSEQPYSIM